MTNEEYTTIREWILELDRKEISLDELLSKLHRHHFEIDNVVKKESRPVLPILPAEYHRSSAVETEVPPI